MKRHGIPLVLAVVVMFIGTASGFASTVEFEVEGASKEAAIAASCRIALEEYFSVKFGKEFVAENRKQVDEGFLSSCESFASPVNVKEVVEGESSTTVKGSYEIDDAKVDEKLASFGLINMGDRSVVVFASERMFGGWIPSYFNSISDGEASLNECEIAVGGALRKIGFDELEASFTDQQKVEAKKMKTVFGRYNDVSSMPNDTILRAAAVVNESAKYSVACNVIAQGDDKKDSAFMFTTCAVANCKTVDRQTGRRIFTASGTECRPNINRMAGSIEAIRAVCTKLGEELGYKITKR